MKSGLLGRKLGHSYSPQIHKYLGDYSYKLFEREPEDVANFLHDGDFHAINVTIPYKKTVMPFCTLTDTASYMGAVNTIVRQPDGSLLGHNTDYFGFTSMVKKSGLDPFGKKCLVLGSGGASVTAVAVLKEMGANVIVISRSGENNYDNLFLHKDAAIICNTTPVGMYPNTGISPIDLKLFPQLEGVLDMIYNPTRTKLLQNAAILGLPNMNGLWMLVAQAKEAAEWFDGVKRPDSIIDDIYHQMQMQMQNIILIGMPGSGKTIIGNHLAKMSGRDFFDSDVQFEEMFGITPAQSILTDGEAAFREKESIVLQELAKGSGLVIATGGGCVTQERNYPILHQNGTIIRIKRDLDLLSTENRPISKSVGITDLARIREPLYNRFADFSINNNGSVDQAVREIILVLGGAV